jgi:hypothetical protein
MVELLSDHDAGTEEWAFVKAVLQGFADIKEGRTATLTKAKKRLGLA